MKKTVIFLLLAAVLCAAFCGCRDLKNGEEKDFEGNPGLAASAGLLESDSSEKSDSKTDKKKEDEREKKKEDKEEEKKEDKKDDKKDDKTEDKKRD